MSAPQECADACAVFLAQHTGRDSLQRADEFGQGDLGRVVNQQADVVVLALELAQFDLEVGAYRAVLRSGSAFRR
ncbi:hypothetical protein GCM10020216_043270 [Nonomuraea helvata]